MTAVNEQLVREYLEMLGFSVRQMRKYSVIARSKAAWEESDLLGVNLAMWQDSGTAATWANRPAPGLWGAAELMRVPSISVSVRGWHTDRFTAQMLASSPELVRFASPEAMRTAMASMHTTGTAAVLFLPDLPTDARDRAAAVDYLVGQGVQGVVLFRTLLLDLLDRVDVKKSYEKSDVLQVLRILKAHRLVQSRQMVLGVWPGANGGTRRPRKAANTTPAAPEEEISDAAEVAEPAAPTEEPEPEPLDDDVAPLDEAEDTLLPPTSSKSEEKE